jgi:hypothetical protein
VIFNKKIILDRGCEDSLLKAQSRKNRALQDFNQGRSAESQQGAQKIMEFDFIRK